jgi:ketosteroid isomerase-like protein
MESDDLEALFAVLTADHVTMPPDGPSMSNSKELRAWHEQRISAYAISGNWASSEDLQLQGDWAIDSWRGLTILTPRSGGSRIEMMTKGVWFWRRGPDGTWKLARSIWNGDSQSARPVQR